MAVTGTLLVIVSVLATLLVFVLALLWYAFSSVALMLLLRRADYPRPWGAWIPIYRDWVLLEAGGQNGAWALLSVVPIVANGMATATLGAANLISGFSLGDALVVSPSLNVLMALGVAATIILLIPKICAYITLNHGFGKRSPWWVVLAVVLTPVWAAVLSFRKSQYFRPELARGPRFWGAPSRPGESR